MRGFLRWTGFAFVFVILGVVAAGWWFRREVTVDRALPLRPTSVVIARGTTGHEIATLLARRGVIASPLAFDLLARLRHERSAMRAGEFRFPAHRTLDEVLQAVVTGGAQTAVWVTIPEGYTAREIARTLAERGLGSEANFTRAFLGGSLDLGGVRTRSLEGYLFPDTYLLSVNTTPAAVVRTLTGAFRERLPRDAAARAKALGLTIPEVVTVASLVEREAKVDDERSLMAGVYYNRLRRGMPLEVDATIEYTFAHHKAVISYADLASPSPYNTYKHTGLPPTPIANPGQPSLDAAFHPRRSDYLYYVYAGHGRSAFARTLAEHNANVARYLH